MIGERIRTTRDLAELPAGTILRTNGGLAMFMAGEKCHVAGWNSGGAEDMWSHLPAVVLYQPGSILDIGWIKAEVLREAVEILYREPGKRSAGSYRHHDMIAAGVDLWLVELAHRFEKSG